ncbi:hypothetical protein CEE36_00845 [candidate division TA06 bacterium B3_TA06]|uniref:Secretion system C-terminal sorting domain-containing protein n=1 Tax=candidate division TA06 bacterium B3_TA06 TaxID=2012487 RepID=A0A532VAU3_UNCT6|nr:MAG: hypothetical protein CEE36_00845 [candidate division TA06 bacterium B3_TA06]
MKRIALILLAAVLLLPAVQWETEQVTNERWADSYEPVIAVAPDGSVRILFNQWDNNEERLYLKVAYGSAGDWVIKDVAQVSEEASMFYSIDVDAEGNTSLAYSDWTSMENSDIFYATDEGGVFSPTNLTNDVDIQMCPMLRLDTQGTPHLIFIELLEGEGVVQIYYGWISGTSLVDKEPVTDTFSLWDFYGYDLVLSGNEAPFGRHVFYIGEGGYLWHAYTLPISATSPQFWAQEAINDIPSEYPSARIDASGTIHIAYDADETSIHYVTGDIGNWHDEIAVLADTETTWVFAPRIDLDPNGDPHLVWIKSVNDWYDLAYGNKLSGSWMSEDITDTPDEDEYPGYDRYFAIDAAGYGHVVYDFPDTNYMWQIYHAKSTEPLTGSAIAEQPASSNPLNLEIRGSSVHFSLQVTSPLRLDLYDALGRRVTCIASGTYAAGEHSIPINSTDLSAGVYFIRMEAGGYSACAKFVVTH